MEPDQLSYDKHLLRFHRSEVERAYLSLILQRTRTLNCFGWVISVTLASLFGIVDQSSFPENYRLVLAVRLLYVILAVVMIAVNYRAKESIEPFNSAVFILATGFFCLLLISSTPLDRFSPYFCGIFFTYTGVFYTAGYGFRISLAANLINIVAFITLFGFLLPVPQTLFLLYLLFIFAIWLVFTFVDYLVERLFRENYISDERYKQSLAEVKQLSGLLPICSSCKKIRDDKGYWKELETYLQGHSEILFSHSLCIDCAHQLYGHERWYQKMEEE
ncbi:MAG: hypothetical protein D6B25_12960 [Desulfobulbaceae bacterium]|nr:MAG: hypothetical protein D6B25_12960 [Desulfobulbaceae bacterium]